MTLNTRSPPPSIWGVRIGQNGGLWHDGPPQGARPRAEGEEESQGGRRTTPKTEEPGEKASLRRSDGSVAPQPPKRALGCSFSLNLTRCTQPQRRGHQQGESCWPLWRIQLVQGWVRLSEE